MDTLLTSLVPTKLQFKTAFSSLIDIDIPNYINYLLRKISRIKSNVSPPYSLLIPERKMTKKSIFEIELEKYLLCKIVQN